MATLTAMPDRFSSGTTVVYERSFADHRASDGWQMSVTLAGRNVLTKLPTASGDGFVVTLTTSETAALAAGLYRWSERVQKDGVIVEVGCGTVQVDPDVAAASGDSLQSWAEKTLAVVEAAIAGRLPAGLESYQIHGRAASKIPMAELLALRAKLAAEVESQRPGGSTIRPIQFTFNGR